MTHLLTTGWALALAVTPEPVLPELREGLDPDSVTPGLLGFLVIFGAVLACIPLFRSMTGKLRKVEHTARVQAELEAAEGPDAGSPQPGGSD